MRGEKQGNFGLGLLLVSLLCGCQKSGDNAVARVNGEAITGEEFGTALRNSHGKEILERLINEKLILQEAKKLNLTVTADELKDGVEKVYDSEDERTPPGLEQQVKAGLLLRKITLKDATDAKKHEIYDAYAEQLRRMEISQILVPTEDIAKQVGIALETGSKFEELAATSSIDTATKTRGGKLGTATRRELLLNYGPEICNEVVALKAGSVSKPHRLNATTWIILKVDKVLQTYEELEPVLNDILSNAELNQTIYGPRERSNIESPFLRRTDGNVPLPGQESGPRGKKERKLLDGATVEVDAAPSATAGELPVPTSPANLTPPHETTEPIVSPAETN